METAHTERRAHNGAASEDPADAGAATIVRQAIRLQACLGTLGAVEYLKGQGVPSQVISRVLSGGSVREEDRSSPRPASA